MNILQSLSKRSIIQRIHS